MVSNGTETNDKPDFNLKLIEKRSFDEKLERASKLRDKRSFSLSETLLTNQILMITHSDEFLRTVDDVSFDCLQATALWVELPY